MKDSSRIIFLMEKEKLYTIMWLMDYIRRFSNFMGNFLTVKEMSGVL